MVGFSLKPPQISKLTTLILFSSRPEDTKDTTVQFSSQRDQPRSTTTTPEVDMENYVK